MPLQGTNMDSLMTSRGVAPGYRQLPFQGRDSEHLVGLRQSLASSVLTVNRLPHCGENDGELLRIAMS
jgi:hypothetical protein